MKIIFIIPQLSTGGTERQLTVLASELQKKGHTVRILALKEADRPITLPQDLDILTLGIEKPYSLFSVVKFSREFSEFKPDVVHSFLFGFDLFANLAAKISGVKVIISSRRQLALWRRKKHLRFQNLANIFVDAVVCNSLSAAEYTCLTESFLQRGMIYNIPNAWADREIEVQGPLPSKVNRPVIVKVANFWDVKGQLRLIRVFAELKNKYPDAVLWLVGEGYGRSAAEDLCSELGLSDSVIFTGTRQDVGHILKCADLYVHASQNESSPNAVLEAMAAGVPVVAAMCGGVAELLKGGELGTVVLNDSDSALLAGITASLSDKSKAALMAEKAGAAVREKHSPDQMAAGYEKIYRNIESASDGCSAKPALTFFCIGDITVPSTRYRIFQFIPALQALGVRVKSCSQAPVGGNRFRELISLIAGYVQRVIQIRKINACDNVIVQKGITSYRLRSLFSFLSKKSAVTAYDLDDAVTLRNPIRLPRPLCLLQQPNEPEMLASAAEKIIAGNITLACSVEKKCSDVTVIPTVIDTDRYAELVTGSNCDSDELRMVWVGQRSTMPYLTEILKTLDEAAEKLSPKRVILRVICDRFKELDQQTLSFLEIEKVQWNMTNEIETIAGADIGLMPMPDDEWTRGKCGFKALQYMALGITPVLSPVGVNSDIVRNGVDGIHASSLSDWKDAVLSLSADRDLRLSMAVSARERVKQEYSLERWSENWIKSLGVLPETLIDKSVERKRVLIGILASNQKEKTLACIQSVKEQGYESYDVMVVDNGSADDIGSAVLEQHDVTVRKLKKNTGCAGGRNVILEYFRQGAWDYILFLDNDALLKNDTLDKLTAEADKCRDAGIKLGALGPSVVYRDKPDELWMDGGAQIDWEAGWFSGTNQHKRLSETGSESRELDTLTGGFMLATREASEAAGYFTDKYFIYLEDTDWCWRMKKSGYSLRSAPDAVIIHDASSSIGAHSPRFHYLRTRNRLWFFLANTTLSKGRTALNIIRNVFKHTTLTEFLNHRVLCSAASAAGMIRGLMIPSAVRYSAKLCQPEHKEEDLGVLRSIAGNSAVIVMCQVVSMGLALAIAVVLARTYGKEAYGVLTYCFNYAEMFTVLANLGTGIVIVREMSVLKGKEASDFWQSAVVLRLVLLVGAMSLAWFAAPFVDNKPLTMSVMLWAVLGMFAQFRATYGGLLNAKGLSGLNALTSIVRVIVYGLLVSFILLVGGSLVSVSKAALVAGLASFAAVLAVSRKHIPTDGSPSSARMKNLLKVAYPVAISSLLTIVQIRIDTVMLKAMTTDSEVGLYGVAVRLVESSTMLSSALCVATFPFLAIALKESSESVRKISRTLFIALIVLSLPFIVVLAPLAENVLTTLFSSDFSSAGLPLSILCLHVPLAFANTMFANMLFAAGLQRKELWASVVTTVANVTANIILIPRYGAVGAAYGTLICQAAALIVLGSMVGLRGWFRLPLAQILRTVLAGAAVLGLTLLLRDSIHWLILGPASSLLFLVMAFMSADREDRTVLLQVVMRKKRK